MLSLPDGLLFARIMEQFIHLVCKMAPFLLLGFFLAGLMHAFIPGRFFSRYLSAPDFRSVVNAALFGIPLPLCSCGVIPTAMSLRKEGASRGAVVSFLIATPQTGVDSIMATYGLMGLPFAVVRPVAALLTALLGGGLSLAGDRSRGVENVRQEQAAVPDRTFAGRLKEAFHYGFVEMMQDIGRWLVLGLLVAAVIAVFIPEEWFTVFRGNSWASMLLVLCIAIPMYVCATGSIPIAVALMMKGLTPGAALVLLMAGPACNLASILVVRKVLGTRTMAVYLLSITAGAVMSGLLVDYLQFNNVIDFLGRLTVEDACCVKENSLFAVLSGILLLILLFNALVLRRVRRHGGDNTNNTVNMKVYHIEGMSCNHCRMSVEKAVGSVDGVTGVSVDLQAKEARVEGTASPEAVIKAVEEVGFRCSC